MRRAIIALRSCGRVYATSALYVTAPQHIVDQPDFLNAACEMRTSLDPVELLCRLKYIERTLGRVNGSIRYGPRVIDIDIALYGSLSIEVADTPVGDLHVPHRLMLQRTFVLKPLCDLAPHLTHPAFEGTLAHQYAQLCDREAVQAANAATPRLPTRVLPLREDVTWELGGRTYIM